MSAQTIQFGNAVVAIAIEIDDAGLASLRDFSPLGTAPASWTASRQPLAEVLTLGAGRMLTNTRLTHTTVGRGLVHQTHSIERSGVWQTLAITSQDSTSGLRVTSYLRLADDVAALQSWTAVTNDSTELVALQAVTSFAAAGFVREDDLVADIDLLRARSEWCGESRWSTNPLHGRDGLVDINTLLHDHDARGFLTTSSSSTWSSGEYLPTGILENRKTGRSWAWQIEHNGAWQWEVDTLREGGNSLALLLSGPTDLRHQWLKELAPTETFVSIPVSVAVSNAGYAGALAALTGQRRALHTVRAVDAGLPLIYNDYMNTLMGDPTTAKLLPLIDAAADAGAEYFCIDAGWYDDGGAWWGSVGEWKPSTLRFPGGLTEVLDHIRARGMKPGLWLEPEVVGVNSAMVDRLPDDAFISRRGMRVTEHLRYHLDLRSQAAQDHLDSVIDYLVGELGVRYFKLDYNITPGAGTDRDADSAGDGLLQHNRAHLEWLDRMVARHENVIFENCSSGAMRMDYAMMSRLDLQSTSDQQDVELYPSIAVAAPASLLPEQAGNWAYPQPGMSPERIAFSMMAGMTGRLYLSGHLDEMTSVEQAAVQDAVEVYKGYRATLAEAVPFWPLGLPGWFDDTLALGLSTADGDFVAVWQRGEPTSLSIPLADAVGVETLYPTNLESWNPTLDGGSLKLSPAEAMTARLFRITRASS